MAWGNFGSKLVLLFNTAGKPTEAKGKPYLLVDRASRQGMIS
jgi:hypothetical protein